MHIYAIKNSVQKLEKDCSENHLGIKYGWSRGRKNIHMFASIILMIVCKFVKNIFSITSELKSFLSNRSVVSYVGKEICNEGLKRQSEMTQLD